MFLFSFRESNKYNILEYNPLFGEKYLGILVNFTKFYLFCVKEFRSFPNPDFVKLIFLYYSNSFIF